MKKLLSLLLIVALVAVCVPMGAASVEASAEIYVDGCYTYEILNGKAIITDCVQSISGTIAIPSTVCFLEDSGEYGEYPVIAIGADAFRECAGLTGIIIPNGVVAIGDYAFWNCSGLELIVIPGSVVAIGNHAFNDCSSLKKITIPNGVTAIYGATFAGCSSLEEISIPKSVNFIEGWAFSGCNSLTTITIPDGVIDIGDYAFYHCIGLESVTIPSSVVAIGERAFQGCSGLTEITIENGVISIDAGAFAFCGNLESVTIPNSVDTIYNDTFLGCLSLKNVAIPNSVVSIGDRAFYSCESLESIIVPDSVTSIGQNVFGYCCDLESIAVDKENLFYHSADNCLIETASKTMIAGCKNSVIPADGSVIIVDYCAFFGCTGLKSIIIPDSVIIIENSAFQYCSGLKSVAILNNVGLFISMSAFSDCYQLQLVHYSGTEEDWNFILIESGNTKLTSATRHYITKSDITPATCLQGGTAAYYCAECEQTHVSQITRQLQMHTFANGSCRLCGIAESVAPCDLNGDCRADVDDVIEIRKRLFDGRIACDVNNDGKSDIRDLVRMKILLAG